MMFRPILIIVALALSGCASIQRGSTESIEFLTTPSGANVLVVGGKSTGAYCLTPCRLELDRREDLKVEISKKGFKTVNQVLYSSIDAGSFTANTIGNLILAPGVADYWDVKTGANYSHKPNPFVGTLIATESDASDEIPVGFIAANRDWWDKDEKKTRWVKQQHQVLVFSEGLSPNDSFTSRYWTKMLDSIRTFDSLRERDRVDDAESRDTSITTKLTFVYIQPRPYDLAVIIGNQNYLSKDIPTVKSAHNDVVAFRKYAEKGLGIQNVIEVRDASFTQMKILFGGESNHVAKVFNRMSAQPQKGRLFVFYSGHGVASLRDNKGLLVPVDADPQLYSQTAYPLERLYESISKIPATERHVIVDACFSGMSEGGPLIARASPVMISVSEGEVPANVNVVTATSSGEVASWDQGNGNSLFTKFYLLGKSGEADLNGDGDTSAIEFEEYVKTNVRDEALRIHQRSQNPVFKYSVFR